MINRITHSHLIQQPHGRHIMGIRQRFFKSRPAVIFMAIITRTPPSPTDSKNYRRIIDGAILPITSFECRRINKGFKSRTRLPLGLSHPIKLTLVKIKPPRQSDNRPIVRIQHHQSPFNLRHLRQTPAHIFEFGRSRTHLSRGLFLVDRFLQLPLFPLFALQIGTSHYNIPSPNHTSRASWISATSILTNVATCPRNIPPSNFKVPGPLIISKDAFTPRSKHNTGHQGPYDGIFLQSLVSPFLQLLHLHSFGYHNMVNHTPKPMPSIITE